MTSQNIVFPSGTSCTQTRLSLLKPTGYKAFLSAHLLRSCVSECAHLCQQGARTTTVLLSARYKSCYICQQVTAALKIIILFAGLEILTAGIWRYFVRRFGGTYRLHHQDWRCDKQTTNKHPWTSTSLHVVTPQKTVFILFHDQVRSFNLRLFWDKPSSFLASF
jgi:hypothetical protein